MIHVASPFPLDSPVDEMEVIRPAVEGTTNVLEACANTKGGVKRVVLTSSCAAVYGRTLISNRPFATRDHVVQNPPCWRLSSLLFLHWDTKTKRPEPVKLDLPLF